MPLPPDIADAATLLGAGVLFLAALRDIAVRLVPNTLPLIVAACGLLAQALSGTLPAAAAAGAVVFVLAAFCWRRGWMGGADVKLLGAAALLVPPMLVPSLIAAIALAGGVLAIPYILARGRLRAADGWRPAGLVGRAVRAERRRLRRGGPMPYAAAIAGGVCFILSHGSL